MLVRRAASRHGRLLVRSMSGGGKAQQENYCSGRDLHVVGRMEELKPPGCSSFFLLGNLKSSIVPLKTLHPSEELRRLPSCRQLVRCQQFARHFATDPGTQQDLSVKGAEVEVNSSKAEGGTKERLEKAKKKRFFERAWAKEAAPGQGFVVMLDDRELKTPAKKVVQVPSKALALAIAAEWQWQEPQRLQPFTMPLMKLAATTIDQVPRDRDRIIETLIKYFHTDSILCRAPPSLLADKQTEVWDPLLDWVSTLLQGHRPVPSSDLFAGDQSETLVDALRTFLESVDDWHLAAIDSIAGSARSLIISLALVHGHLGIKDAVEAIRLEEDFQVEEWGFVEGGHDIDIADIQVKLSSPTMFLRLLKA